VKAPAIAFDAVACARTAGPAPDWDTSQATPALCVDSDVLLAPALFAEPMITGLPALARALAGPDRRPATRPTSPPIADTSNERRLRRGTSTAFTIRSSAPRGVRRKERSCRRSGAAPAIIPPRAVTAGSRIGARRGARRGHPPEDPGARHRGREREGRPSLRRSATRRSGFLRQVRRSECRGEVTNPRRGSDLPPGVTNPNNTGRLGSAGCDPCDVVDDLHGPGWKRLCHQRRYGPNGGVVAAAKEARIIDEDDVRLTPREDRP
jgi:hypothetical protein